jgi:uncharacterized protein with von Willebrand factor type A (vWA) domain
VTDDELPLVELFTTLRLDADLPLGIDEYLIMLRALQMGFGSEDLESLRRLCYVLWTNSLSEQRSLDYYFQLFFQERQLKQQALLKVLPAQDRIEKPRQIEPDTTVTGFRARPEQEPGSLPLSSVPVSTVTKPAGIPLESHTPPSGLPGISFDENQAARATHAALQRSSLSMRSFIFSGDYLPVTRRQMKQTWRHLRSLVKEGPRVILNIKATVEKIGREGLLIEPVLEPRRINRMELLLFIDRKGSMVPFHGLADRLVESAQKGGRLAQAGVFYFSNVPRDHLYLTPALVKARSLESILRHLHSERTVALIFSDAGAARNHKVDGRIEQTVDFLQRLETGVRRFAWINPMPRHRWEGNSAEEIARLVPMFEFSRRDLDAAIDMLRGRNLPILAHRRE